MNFSLIPLLLLQQLVPGVSYVGSTGEGVQMANQTCKQIPAAHRRFIRWVYCRHDKDDLRPCRSLSVACNFGSQGDFIVRPIVSNPGWLVQIDLRNYDPSLTDWPKFWEEFALDPAFSTLITRDMLRFNSPEFFLSLGLTRASDSQPSTVTEEGGDAPTVPAPLPDGRTPVTREWLAKRFEAEKISVIKLPPQDVDQAALAELQLMTGSLAPIVDHRYLKYRMLSSIQEDGPYHDVYGGLYYEFSGIKKSKTDGVTDLDQFLRDLGISENVFGLLDRTRTDLRAAMLNSEVRGFPRAVCFFDVQARDVNSKAAITFDTEEKDIDLAQRAFANLSDFGKSVRAYEVIAPKRNGMPRVGLFNGQQALQAEAPSGQGGVVDDYTVPKPHNHRLFSVKSCLACHGVEGDFWQEVHNDVPRIYAAQLNIDPGNLNSFLDPHRAARLRLIGQFKGDGIPTAIARNRQDYQRKIRECVETGPGMVWEHSDPAKGYTDVGKLVSQYLTDEYNDYKYGRVDAETALAEIGFQLEKIDKEGHDGRRDRATATFGRLVPVSLLSDVSGLPGEHPTIAAIRVGLSVPRTDWNFVRSFVAGAVKRATRTAPKQQSQPTKKAA